MEVVYINHSIANRFSNHIEINENLKKYPELHNQILAHEFKHEDGGFTFNDLKLDLTQRINIWQLSKFMIKHPKSFLQFAPIYYSRKKGFVWDMNLILFYIFLIILVLIGFYLSIRL